MGKSQENCRTKFQRINKVIHRGISFWLDFKDVSGNVTSTEELGLTDLRLEAIDLLYIENSELEARLNYYGKREDLITMIFVLTGRLHRQSK